MDQAVKNLTSKKESLDTTVETLSTLKDDWTKKGLADYSGGLTNIIADMKRDAKAIDLQLEDLQTENMVETTENVMQLLIRRTERQIRARSRTIQLPQNFNDGTDKKGVVTDRVMEPSHMWVVHYTWRTLSQRGSWNSNYISARDAHASFLCGREEGQDWAVRVPGTITTVEKALEWITPGEVKKAQRLNRTVFRQGDMYFVPMRIYRHDLSELRRGSGRHSASANDWTDGNTAFTVSHPQHKKLKLEGLENGYAWRAVGQRQMGNYGERVAAD